MGLCCSCEITDRDVCRPPYSPELTPTIDSPEEDATVEESEPQTPHPSEQAAHVPHTNNREALERARAARQSMPLPSWAASSEPPETGGERV